MMEVCIPHQSDQPGGGAVDNRKTRTNDSGGRPESSLEFRGGRTGRTKFLKGTVQGRRTSGGAPDDDSSQTWTASPNKAASPDRALPRLARTDSIYSGPDQSSMQRFCLPRMTPGSNDQQSQTLFDIRSDMCVIPCATI